MTKAGKACRATAVFASGLCIQHDPDRADDRALAEELRLEAITRRVTECQYGACNRKVKGANLYCSPAHKVKAKVARQRAGGALAIAKAQEALPTSRADELRNEVRRGEVYQRIIADGYAPLLATGALTFREVAEALDCSVAAVSRALAAYQIDVAVSAAGDGWTRPHLPPLSLETVDVWVDAFLGFRDVFFVTRHGTPFVTTPYMRRWVRSLFVALATGGRQLILSPPRHGKTELLTHVAIFLICYNPNICILWLSKAEDVAKASVRAIMDHLEKNADLIATFCPPGEQFRPFRGKSTKQWSPSGGEFTVATRTITGITSPTMAALSRTGTVRNRSADLIVMDDLEDHKSTQEEHQREATRNMIATELESRKEEETAWLAIGSRAHIDDWYHYALMDPEWEVIVEEAHNSECGLDPLAEELHVDCMLWPGVRTYRWLQQKFRSAEAQGRREIAEMVYQNRPSAVGVRTFTPEVIHPCYDRSRDLGDIPPGTTLIGGLDPSGANFQAAFLWAFRVIEIEEQEYLGLWMVDIENRKGGGIAAARETVAAWYEQYRLTWWCIEDNLYQGGIRDDEALIRYVEPRGIRLTDYHTGGEKWDRHLGVSSLEPMFAKKLINLPYATAEAQAATNKYVAQLLRFSSESRVRGSRRPTDLVMASWFPLEQMRLELDAVAPEPEVEYDQSFPGYEGSEIWEVPW